VTFSVATIEAVLILLRKLVKTTSGNIFGCFLYKPGFGLIRFSDAPFKLSLFVIVNISSVVHKGWGKTGKKNIFLLGV
jgi:hypothetical protein